MAGLAWHGMVWLGARARCFHNEVRCYLPTQYLKFGTFCQVIAAPSSGFWEGIRRQFGRGMFHIFAKTFHFGTPHLLDFQVAAWCLAGLYACFRKVAPLALPVEVFALVHCHHTPTLSLHPPPPPRARSLVSSRQAKAWLAWLGMVWYGLVREPGAFIMNCGATCRHNISKLNSGLSVKLLQLPLRGFGKALGDNLEGACSIFLQKGFILVRHIYWIFRLLRAGWLGCTHAFVKWHLWPYPLKFSLWFTATTHPHCHCTPRHPPARARSPRLVKPRHGWLGLAWYGMAWCESQVLS